MKLNLPIHQLKQQAKALKHADSITMVAALDQIARHNGYTSWSLLHTKNVAHRPKTADEILKQLHPQDLLLIAARPNLGKTKLAMQVLLRAIQQGRQCFFFSFEYTQAQAIAIFVELGMEFDNHKGMLHIDVSEQISAKYIISKTKKLAIKGSIIVIDYLQLLDQQRSKLPVQQQVEALKAFAAQTECIIIFISQIDREFDVNQSEIAALKDVRLPNPLDLSLFNKSIFL